MLSPTVSASFAARPYTRQHSNFTTKNSSLISYYDCIRLKDRLIVHTLYFHCVKVRRSHSRVFLAWVTPLDQTSLSHWRHMRCTILFGVNGLSWLLQRWRVDKIYLEIIRTVFDDKFDLRFGVVQNHLRNSLLRPCVTFNISCLFVKFCALSALFWIGAHLVRIFGLGTHLVCTF